MHCTSTCYISPHTSMHKQNTLIFAPSQGVNKIYKTVSSVKSYLIVGLKYAHRENKSMIYWERSPKSN